MEAVCVKPLRRAQTLSRDALYPTGRRGWCSTPRNCSALSCLASAESCAIHPTSSSSSSHRLPYTSSRSKAQQKTATSPPFSGVHPAFFSPTPHVARRVLVLYTRSHICPSLSIEYRVPTLETSTNARRRTTWPPSLSRRPFSTRSGRPTTARVWRCCSRAWRGCVDLPLPVVLSAAGAPHQDFVGFHVLICLNLVGLP